MVLHLRSESALVLFTQCSKCETVFKLSAEVLRAAGGQVRCGKCGEIFNALARLAEDPSAFTATESEFDLEARADSILESAAPLQAPATAQEPENHAPHGVEIARLQILDWSDGELPHGQDAGSAEESEEPAADTSMEFSLPPKELDRIFVESKARQRRSALAPAVEAPGLPLGAEEIEPAGAERRAAPVSGIEVPDDIRREMLSGLEKREPPLASARRPAGLRFHLWLIAAVAFALLLIGQVVHQNREWLGNVAPLGAALRALYSSLGAPVSQPANLSA